MEISYLSGIIWYLTWPLVIYLGYKFSCSNIKHLEEKLK